MVKKGLSRPFYALTDVETDADYKRFSIHYKYCMHLAACPGGSDCVDCTTSKSQKCDMCSNRKYWDPTSSTCSSRCQQVLQSVYPEFASFKQKSYQIEPLFFNFAFVQYM